MGSTPHPPIPPGAWLGLLGGGQLGRMFCMEAQSLGYRVCVLDPAEDGPAASVADHHLRADYLDPWALDELGGLCRAVTTEFENVPAQALRRLAACCVVAPGPEAVCITQDRLAEKGFVRDQGVDVAPYAAVRGAEDLHAAPDALFPGILKVSRLGYDGKGQARVADREAALAAFVALGEVPCVLERQLDLALELSVVVARGFDGQAEVYPVAENVHRGGILAVSTSPARVPRALAAQAAQAALTLAQRLEYVGVLCVEFFVLNDGALLVNELAPRPHNSGHHTLDSCFTSQFEQQVRALAGLPLGVTTQHSAAVMVNLLGELWVHGSGLREPDWAAVLAEPRAALHLYGKRDPRRGRKMGHVTVLGVDTEQAAAGAARVAARLGL